MLVLSLVLLYSAHLVISLVKCLQFLQLPVDKILHCSLMLNILLLEELWSS